MEILLILYGAFLAISVAVMFNAIRHAKVVDPKEPFLYDDCDR